MEDRLTQLARRGPVVFDGAMGTELHDRGAPPGACLEHLNLSSPTRVAEVHRDYIAAGADVIETNTFGANRFGLGDHYLEAQVRAINLAGARLAVDARNASGRPVLVAGSVGPLGRAIEPVGAIKRSSAERIFREQITALAEGGADLLVLETFTALDELLLAAGVARAVAPGLPFVAQVSFDDEARPADAARALVQALSSLAPAAIGANCGSGPAAVLNVTEAIGQAGAPLVSAMPNAGLPRRAGGRLVYTFNPEYFADYAARLIGGRVKLVGGCCGTGPRHIAALRARLDRRAGTSENHRPGRLWTLEEDRAEAPATPASTGLAARLAAGGFALSVELTPPRGIDSRRVLDGARLMAEAGVDFANVTDSAMARLRMGVMSCAALVQQQVGLEAIAHLTCRDRNVMAIQSELIGAHALGIRNVLALRGDPPRIGDYPHATGVWDVNAVGLITILANMNRGLDANGTPIGQRASFHVGAAVNPAAPDPDRELRLLRAKVAAGAHFVVSNPVFDPGGRRRLMEIIAAVPVPVLAGVMPLLSLRHAEYLHHEVPGMVVPEPVRRRLAGAGSAASEAGVEMAVEFVEAVRGHAHGLYLIPAAGRYDVAAQVVMRTRELVARG